jgi:outer membrane protein TolC
VALLERQLAAGAISPFEFTQARLGLDTIRLSLHDAARQQAEARVQLADALGITVQALDGITLAVDQFQRVPAEVPADDVRRQALLNRPDILGLLAEYAASQAALQLEIARQYPDIHLGPGYEMDQWANKWTLGLSAVLPLFSRNRGPIAEADARRTLAAARFTALQLHAIADIDRSFAGYRAALDKAATTEAMLGKLRQQERSARALFDAGEISRLDLGVVQLQLAASDLARLEAIVGAQGALGLLEDAIQRPADIADWVTTTPPRDAAPVKH